MHVSQREHVVPGEVSESNTAFREGSSSEKSRAEFLVSSQSILESSKLRWQVPLLQPYQAFHTIVHNISQSHAFSKMTSKSCN